MKSKSEKVNEQMEIGNIGENFFINYFVSTIKTFYDKKIVDLRGTSLEKDNDIDFLIVPKDYDVNIKSLEWQEKVKNELYFHTENSLKNEQIFAVEVKTDKKAFFTNRMAYDITSHDKRGGCARSLCDFLFYVVINEQNNVYQYSMLNMFKFRRYIGENCDKINKIKDFFLKYMKDKENESDGKSLLLLTGFEYLEKNNIGNFYKL